MNFTKLTFILLISIVVSSCTSNEKMKENMTQILKDDPSILTAAIEKHPLEFMEALQKAAKESQEKMAKKREEEEKTKLESAFDNPLKPHIRADETIRGPKEAPITLVEYSDFECPFCSRGFQTVQDLLAKYKGKIRFVYKHLPLSFHEQAMISAQYYEALRLQDEKKAFLFHDALFKNQAKLKNGVAFLDATAKEVGANMNKLKQDVNSAKVKERIAEDVKEANLFGMEGTPGFVLNGVPIKGAYPLEYFVSLIETLQKKGKLKI